jgi:hypothetical protein
MRNKIINGAMVIDQRNAGASINAADNSYCLDRWYMQNYPAANGVKYTVQQNAGSVTPPAGFPNYIGITSNSAYTLAADSIYNIAQFIEGFNVSDLGWGSANAKTITLSFWVRSSLTGTFGGCLSNSAYNRSYPFTYTISAANTWEQKTITVAGDTSGTWLTTNGVGIRVLFSLGTGTTYSGTANAWAGSDYRSPTGATSVVGTNGATFYITGVQLERGTVATPFEYRNYQQELAMCMRYYEVTDTISGFSGSPSVIGVSTTYTTGLRWNMKKRASPTVTIYNRAGTAGKVSSITTGSAVGTTVTANNVDTLGCQTLADSASGFSSGAGYEANYTASAEL